MKTEVVINDPASSVLKKFAHQIRMDVYEATAKISHPDLVTKNEVAYAKVVIDSVWTEFANAITEAEIEFNLLLKKEKWSEAKIFLLDFQLKMQKFGHGCLQKKIVSEYVQICTKNNCCKELEYVPWCNVLMYSPHFTTHNIDPRISDYIALDSFYTELCKLWGLALAVGENMEAQLFEKRYNMEWDKYSERVISIYEIFKDPNSLIYALKKMEAKELIIINGDRPTLIYKERGRKRLLAAWLTRCYNKGFITAKHDFTTCAKVVLTYFGMTVKSDNDVRDFLGSNIPDSYYDLLGKWD